MRNEVKGEILRLRSVCNWCMQGSSISYLNLPGVCKSALVWACIFAHPTVFCLIFWNSVVMNLFIFNCLMWNINLLIFNCLTSNFCFAKYISFSSRRKRKKQKKSRKERLFMDVCPYFPISNSPGNMMTCYRWNINKIFDVAHLVHEYTRMRIPNKRY